MSHLPRTDNQGIRPPIDPDEAWEISKQFIDPERRPLPEGAGVWVGDAPPDEPEDQILVQSGILPHLIDAAKNTLVSPNWEQELAAIGTEDEDDFPAPAKTGWVKPLHIEAPENEPHPRERVAFERICLHASTTPRSAADLLRSYYTAEWIADLLVCLLFDSTDTETP